MASALIEGRTIGWSTGFAASGKHRVDFGLFRDEGGKGGVICSGGLAGHVGLRMRRFVDAASL